MEAGLGFVWVQFNMNRGTQYGYKCYIPWSTAGVSGHCTVQDVERCVREWLGPSSDGNTFAFKRVWTDGHEEALETTAQIPYYCTIRMWRSPDAGHRPGPKRVLQETRQKSRHVVRVDMTTV